MKTENIKMKILRNTTNKKKIKKNKITIKNKETAEMQLQPSNTCLKLIF